MVSQYSFPPEVWTIVFQITSQRYYYPRGTDFKNLRLTCKLFEKLATPFLMPRIICAPVSSSLATLTAVSRHPVLSKSVKEVIYVCNRYDFFDTLPEYKEALRRAGVTFSHNKFKEPKSEEDNLDLKTAFSLYVQSYNDQKTMEDAGVVIGYLCSALLRMPSIEKLTFSPNFGYCMDSDNRSRYFLELQPAYNQAFLLMARVLSLTGTTIRDLDFEVDITRSHGGLDGTLFRGMSRIDLDHCCDAFRGLRNVSITVDDSDIDGWMTGNLAEILSGATDLERLCLYCGGGIFDIPIKYTLGRTTWSRLTSLDFSSAGLDQADFLLFLKRHSATLKDIDLDSINLKHGSWKILLEEMKSCLSLRRVSIRHPYEADSDTEIYMGRTALESYLLGNGPHPLSV